MSTFLQSFDVPRQIPLSMKVSLVAANVFFFIGAIFFILGMAFMIGFSFLIDFKSMGFGNDLKKTSGEIVQVEATNSKINNVRVYQFEYRYFVNDKSYTGYSYQTGMGSVRPGDDVTIEYENAQPELSRIEGMDMSEVPFWILSFFLIFPLIGLLFLVIAIRRGIKHIKLVTNGILTKGKVIRKERTNTRINNRYVYRVFFEFKGPDGKLITSSVNTHHTHLVEDEPEEMLVYDPDKPEKAALLDALPKSVKKFFTQDRY